MLLEFYYNLIPLATTGIIYLILYFIYRSTLGGSRGWQILVAAGLLYSSFPLSTVFYPLYKFSLPWRFIPETFFAIIPSLLVPIGLLYLYNDFVQKKSDISFAYLLIYQTVILGIFFAYSISIWNIGKIYTLASYFLPTFFILPATLWAYRLLRATKRKYWILFILGYPLHAVSLMSELYRHSLCGIGGNYRFTDVCLNYVSNYHAVFNVPLNETLNQISLLPMYSIGIALYLIPFLFLVLSIRLKGELKTIKSGKESLAEEIAKNSVEEIGNIIGSPLAYKIAAHSIEGTEIKEKIDVSEERLKIKDGDEFKLLEKFLEKFISGASNTIGPTPKRVLLKMLGEETKDVPELNSIYRKLLADKELNGVYRRIKDSGIGAGRIVSEAIKDSDISEKIEIKGNKLNIKADNKFEVLKRAMKLIYKRLEEESKESLKSDIFEFLTQEEKEYPEVKEVINSLA